MWQRVFKLTDFVSAASTGLVLVVRSVVGGFFFFIFFFVEVVVSSVVRSSDSETASEDVDPAGDLSSPEIKRFSKCELQQVCQKI